MLHFGLLAGVVTDLQCSVAHGVIPLPQDGVAMESPLSPIIANLFMEDLEEEAIHSA